ncbi:MAG: ABC transporter substrate-binding protein [Candidatus Binatia bacterium]
MKKEIWIFILFSVFVMSSALRAGTAEEMFHSLRGLSPEERQAKLASEAKKEGSVTWYSTTSNSQLQKFMEGFNKKYPYIKLQWVRGKTHLLVNRMTAEAGAGKHLVDITNSGASGTQLLVQRGLLIPVESQIRDAYDPEFKDDKGYWVNMTVFLCPFAYNTDLVKPEEAPKSFADLLDPKWKGKMALDTRPNRFVPALLQEWGEERSMDYFKKLAAQEPILVRGHTAAAQLLAAGQFPILIEPFAYSTLRLKHQGAPIDIVWQKEFVPGSHGAPLAILKKAPHPHAALLLYEYVLSEEGQKIFVDVGRTPTRRGLQPKFPEVKEISKRVRLALIKPESAAGNLKRVSTIMKEIFLKK